MSTTTTHTQSTIGDLLLGSTQLSLRDVATETFKKYYMGLNPTTTTGVYALMLAKMELPLLKQTLKFVRENQSQAAVVLGLSRGNLRKLLKQYGMLEKGSSADIDAENTPGPLDSALSKSINDTVKTYYADVEPAQTTSVYDMVLAEVEEPLMIATLQFTRNNQSRAAIVLGISRGTLRKLMKQYGLQ
jgi:Fis family transcriptional regulator